VKLRIESGLILDLISVAKIPMIFWTVVCNFDFETVRNTACFVCIVVTTVMTNQKSKTLRILSISMTAKWTHSTREGGESCDIALKPYQLMKVSIQLFIAILKKPDL
jgi:hypothetical protein